MTGVVLANASLSVALHDTYYVVMDIHPLTFTGFAMAITIAILPTGSVTYDNAAISEGTIRTSYNGERGVYL